MQGRIIAIEGVDKAGKHTQVMNIVRYLQDIHGIKTETIDFPQYKSFFGQFIKNYLNGNFGASKNLPPEYTMLPYALDRLQQQPKIQQWVKDGKWVVFDRYTYSNVFSVAKTPHIQWDDKIAFLEELEFNQLGIIKPDHNIYLYVDPNVAFNMRNQGLKEYQNGRPDIHESDSRLLHDVADVYHHIANTHENWQFINEMKADNTRMSISEVFQKIRPFIDGLVKSR